jgi:hypothetical protein
LLKSMSAWGSFQHRRLRSEAKNLGNWQYPSPVDGLADVTRIKEEEVERYKFDLSN